MTPLLPANKTLFSLISSSINCFVYTKKYCLASYKFCHVWLMSGLCPTGVIPESPVTTTRRVAYIFRVSESEMKKNESFRNFDATMTIYARITHKYSHNDAIIKRIHDLNSTGDFSVCYCKKLISFSFFIRFAYTQIHTH